MLVSMDFGDGAERYVTLLKLLGQVNQVPQGSGKPVKPPADDGISGAGDIQCLGKLWSISTGTTADLDEHPLASSLLEGIKLQGMILLVGGDPCVSDQHPAYSRNSSDLCAIGTVVLIQGFETVLPATFVSSGNGLGASRKPPFVGG